jgi:hypothetical protein
VTTGEPGSSDDITSEGPWYAQQDKDQCYQKKREGFRVGSLFTVSVGERNAKYTENHSNRMFNPVEPEETIFHDTGTFRHSCGKKSISTPTPLIKSQQQRKVRSNECK